MRVAILMPVRDALEPATMTALTHYTDGLQPSIFSEVGLPVEIARNRLWTRACAMRPSPGVVLWIDADAFWEPGTFRHLAARLPMLGPRDLLVAFHGPRRSYAPLNVARVVDGESAGLPIDVAHRAPDGLAEVAFGGAHFYAHGPGLLAALPPDPWTIGDAPSEDSAFCYRVRAAGGRILLDTRVPVWHVEGDDGFLPGRPRYTYANGRMTPTTEAPPTPDNARTAPWRSYGDTVDEARRRYLAERGTDESAMCDAALPAPDPLGRRRAAGLDYPEPSP